MQIAVIIPFRGNPDVLQWALAGFAAQVMPSDYTLEVRLCGDGVPVPPCPESLSPNIRFAALESSRVGISEAKNLLLRDKPADVVIFANADTRPIPTFVQAHVNRLAALPPGSMVLGSSPYESAPGAFTTVFDVLKEDTPMIFFYSQMRPHESYDFRHPWNLNVSVRYADLARINFFNPLFRPYGYEDLDLAYRLMGPKDRRVYFDPAAQLIHRHSMTLDDYLNREELLGIMAPVLARANPEAFAAIYGSSSLDQLAADFRGWIKMDPAAHRWVYKRLAEWSALPEDSLGTGDLRKRVLMTIYQMHIPLKRLAFRLGFLHGLNLVDDSCWQERRSQGLWRKFVQDS